MRAASEAAPRWTASAGSWIGWKKRPPSNGWNAAHTAAHAHNGALRASALRQASPARRRRSSGTTAASTTAVSLLKSARQNHAVVRLVAARPASPSASSANSSSHSSWAPEAHRIGTAKPPSTAVHATATAATCRPASRRAVAYHRPITASHSAKLAR